jgi:hypothetical protein
VPKRKSQAITPGDRPIKEGHMISRIGVGMVRLRVIATEEEDDARILAHRKKRREEMLAEAVDNPRPHPTMLASWWRARRSIVVGR